MFVWPPIWLIEISASAFHLICMLRKGGVPGEMKGFAREHWQGQGHLDLPNLDVLSEKKHKEIALMINRMASSTPHLAKQGFQPNLKDKTGSYRLHHLSLATEGF